MKKNVLLLLLPILLYFTLTSATYIKPVVNTTGQSSLAIGPANNSKRVKPVHLNFFQRFAIKVLLKKRQLMDEVRANKLAHTSLTFGIVAASTFLLGLFIPYIILLCIPAGIAAMITGSAALRNNTTLPGKARTGKGLGLGALIAFGVILIVAAIVVAAFVSSWH